MPSEHDKYVLKVTAGPAYDPSTHSLVKVNSPEPITVSTPDIDAKIYVRIQNYRGLPSDSPQTCEYFSHPLHTSSLYSISFSFTLPRSLSGDDLVFGNDFDRPIRDKLPPGFGTAFRIVKWAIDPGLTGDVNADKPWLYGRGLSSWNTFRIGKKLKGKAAPREDNDGRSGDDIWRGDVIEEGAEGDGEDVREKSQLPAQGNARMRHFLDAEKRKEFTFEEGREYQVDFFNPYLDFNEFALRLPGFSLHILPYWDGQPLRYVLRDRSKDTVLFVVLFDLIPVDKAGKEAELAGTKAVGEPSQPKSENTDASKAGSVLEKLAEGSSARPTFIDADVD